MCHVIDSHSCAYVIGSKWRKHKQLTKYLYGINRSDIAPRPKLLCIEQLSICEKSVPTFTRFDAQNRTISICNEKTNWSNKTKGNSTNSGEMCSIPKKRKKKRNESKTNLLLRKWICNAATINWKRRLRREKVKRTPCFCVCEIHCKRPYIFFLSN